MLPQRERDRETELEILIISKDTPAAVSTPLLSSPILFYGCLHKLLPTLTIWGHVCHLSTCPSLLLALHLPSDWGDIGFELE